MKGIEIAKKYYLEYGAPMLDEQFSEVKDRIAVGLVGEGSECFSYDDNISRDHDFEPGFCMFITKEDDDKFGFKLASGYSKLPKTFMGLKRSVMMPTGGNRHGVIIIEDFYAKFLGCPVVPQSLENWLYLPTHSLASACNGEVFVDKLGKFSEIRNQLLKGYPEDVRLKKLAGHILMMAQSGQYNYGRLIDRGETGASQLAVFEFVKNAIATIYLLNNKYQPFYKWAYRGMRDLEVLGDLESALSTITEMGNGKSEASEKREIIEDICLLIIQQLKGQKITTAVCDNLETHAYSINDKIKDASFRNLHIMSGV